jgi:hypothetical protein
LFQMLLCKKPQFFAFWWTWCNITSLLQKDLANILFPWRNLPYYNLQILWSLSSWGVWFIAKLLPWNTLYTSHILGGVFEI